MMDKIQQKIVTKDFFERQEDALHRQKIVFTNGCFDILHAGHVDYLRKAANLGNILIIGLNSDESVHKLKGASRPINNQNDRAEVLSALSFVDYIAIFDEDTPLNLIKEIRPSVLVKGGDYKKEEIVGADVVLDDGGRVEIIDFVENKSTTNIIEKMKESIGGK